MTRLFLELFRISLFIIGGGYSIILEADRRFSRLGWIREGELIDHLPVFQTVPGLIATHTAVYLGRKRGGAVGAAVAVAAVALPAVVVFSAVSVWYRMIPLGNPWLESAFVGLRASLTGIIAATIVRSWRKSLPDAFAYALAAVSVAAIGFAQMHIAAVLLAAATAGLTATVSRGTVRSFQLLPLLLFAEYGSLCFGGGFVLVPMYLHDFVGPLAPWLQLSEGEFGDIMAISQMTPGPVGVNCATFFGYRLAGFGGALAASALLLLPGSTLSYFALSSLERFRDSRTMAGILRGIRPASIALMLVALYAFARLTFVDGGRLRFWGVALVVASTAAALTRRVNLVILIILTALFASAVRADEPEVTAAVYPDADTVILDDFDDIEYFADGTSRVTSENWTKALTEAGRRELGTCSLDYNRRYGTGRIAEVTVISPDGARRTLDLEGLVKDTTDNSAVAANIYDPLDRRIVCSVPGVKVGDTVYVRKERATVAARCENQWADLSVFEAFSPIVRARMRVKCPKERPIRSLAVRNPLGNLVSSTTTNDDGSVVMTWCATNSPQAFPEPSMPAAYRQLQHVTLSTAADWRELSRWYWRLCEPHLAKTNAAMVAKARELGTVEGIFRFVSQEIRYMGLTLEDRSPGYSPHDVDLTFDHRYGVCRDKAALLAAMLRIAGYRAYPVLIMAGPGKMDPDVPMPYFNHAIVAVERPEGRGAARYRLLDPTDESSRPVLPSYESDCSFLVAREEGEGLLTTPMPPAEDNLLKIDSTATLAADGSMFFQSDLRFLGLNDNLFRNRLLRRKGDERRKYFEAVVASAWPGARLLKCDISPENLQDTAKELNVQLSAQLPEALLRGDTEDRLAVGWLSGRLGVANLLLAGRTALERRRFPLRLPSTAGVEESLRVKLGDAVGRVRSLPPVTEIAGDYEYCLAYEVDGSELVAHRVLKVNSLEFSPERYQALREEVKRVEAAERRLPVFAENRFLNADLHRILGKTEVGFSSDGSWTVTNTTVTRVLTYDGKKRASELKFDFNPATRQVRLLTASVTDAKGMTRLVGEQEVNELDCAWAASAPRYPAGRKLVVSLPAVEVGSVITTVVETAVSASPSGFRMVRYRDTVEPADELMFRVGDYVERIVRPKRVPHEPYQPEDERWRDCLVTNRMSFAAAAAELSAACELKPLDPSVLDPAPAGRDARSLRDWMARHVRIAGPGLWEVPVRAQLTDPERVISDRYATQLDYVRTLAALLNGAGYDADIVFAADDGGLPAERRLQLMGADPRPDLFRFALCRLRVREGGWLWFGGERKTYFLGTENEYAPLECTTSDGCDFFDPVTAGFGVVRAVAEPFREREETTVVMTVRENGGVDYDYEALYRGAYIGTFRKRYEELLPEERSRHYQELLGSVSQAATATGELVTDTTGYPARLAYSCFVPDYAVADGGRITLNVPGLADGGTLADGVRRSPLALGERSGSCERWRIVFPEGYARVESMPQSFRETNPLVPDEVWREVKVTTTFEGGRLIVEIIRETRPRAETTLAAEWYALIRDRRRNASSRAQSVIVVGR